jgi:hypothetical protein
MIPGPVRVTICASLIAVLDPTIRGGWPSTNVNPRHTTSTVRMIHASNMSVHLFALRVNAGSRIRSAGTTDREGGHSSRVVVAGEEEGEDDDRVVCDDDNATSCQSSPRIQGGSTPPPLTCITRIPGIQRQTLRLIHHMQPFTHTPQPSRPHHTMLPHSLATHNPSALSLTSNPLFPNPTTAPYCNSHAHYSTALHPPHELCQPVPPDDCGRQEHVPKRNYGIPLGRDNQVR